MYCFFFCFFFPQGCGCFLGRKQTNQKTIKLALTVHEWVNQSVAIVGVHVVCMCVHAKKKLSGTSRVDSPFQTLDIS